MAVAADSAQWIATAARKPEMMTGNATMTACGVIPAAGKETVSATARQQKLTLTSARLAAHPTRRFHPGATLSPAPSSDGRHAAGLGTEL